MAPRVITITNQKGGTGKTTLTALLGYALASRGHKVLLLDLDPQAHLSSFFIPVNKLENVDNGVIQMAQRRHFEIYETNLTKGRLDIVPSGLNSIISTYRGELPSTDAYAIDYRIRTEPEINKKYEYILCDTAPELFAPTIWGLYAADYILIPANNEELSFAGVRLLIKEVLPDILSAERKRTPKVLGIVLVNVVRGLKSNSINKLNDEFKKLTTQLPITTRERFYKKPIFDTIVYRYQKLRDLMYRPRRKGVPLV